MRTSNRESRKYVRELLPFKGSNLHGEWIGEKYVVFSYGWYPLFVYDRGVGKWYSNKDRYSQSTSKQYGQCHPLEKTIELGIDAMKQLVGEK